MTTARIEIPQKLQWVFEGDADVRGSYGGRGSAKTRTFAKMTAVRTLMWDAAGREGIILCGRQFMNSLDESSLEEIKAAIRSEPWLEAAFDIGEKFIRTKSGRIAYKFTGLDRNVDSVKSKARILLGWVDEAEPVTDEAWTKLIPTLREEDSELWVTWNPENKLSATHKRFRLTQDPRYRIAEMNWRDNPWFPEKLNRDRIRDRRDRPDDYHHIWEGAFKTVFQGAYYAKEINQAESEGRVSSVPYDKSADVYASWDLGIGDMMALWVFQIVGKEWHFLRYYENNGHGLDHYVDWIKALPFTVHEHLLPHDGEARELQTGKSRKQFLEDRGFRVSIVPRHNVDDGINAVRMMLNRAWFDATLCEKGIDCLRMYRSEFDNKLQVLKTRPLHDWASHGADAFRCAVMGAQESASKDAYVMPSTDWVV